VLSAWKANQDGGMAVISRETVEKLVEVVPCQWCGGPLTLKWYDHPDGVRVEGVEGKVWVYGKCKRCGCQWSLLKMLRWLARAYGEWLAGRVEETIEWARKLLTKSLTGVRLQRTTRTAR